MQWIIHYPYYVPLLMLWSSSCSGEPQLLCSPETLQVDVGMDVVLPCQVFPPVDMNDKKLQWTRIGQPDNEYVFVTPHPEGDDVIDGRFQHRTSLFSDELVRGNISVSLDSVYVRDEGTYQCHAPETTQQTCFFTLSVVEATGPYITVSSAADGGLSFLCESGCWHPEPDITWLDGEGNLLPAQRAATSGSDSDSHCRYVHSVLTPRRADILTCRVSLLPRSNHTREARVTYSPGLDPRSPRVDEPEDHQGCSLTKAVIICTGVLTASILLAVFYFCFRSSHQRKQWPWLYHAEPPGESLLGVSSTTGLDKTEVPLVDASSDGLVEVNDTKPSSD